MSFDNLDVSEKLNRKYGIRRARIDARCIVEILIRKIVTKEKLKE